MRTSPRSKTWTILGALAIAVGPVGTIAHAGDLNPPPGAVEPTDRTTINPKAITLPHVIGEPGSYVLTGNIQAPAAYAGFGLRISASDVTLDLDGFTLTGDGAGAAIFVDAGVERYAIRDGSISGWHNGIAAQSAPHGEVSGIRITDDLSGGILSGRHTIIRDCVAHNSGNAGIQASDGCVITNCIASNCAGVGIVAGNGSVVRGCSAYDNGIFGISVGAASVVADCSAFSNTGSGIRGGNSLIRGNVSRSNGAPQIDNLGTSTLIENH